MSRSIGERVRALREEAGLSLEKLAYESELGSKGHLSDLERGLVRPTVHSLSRIAERLGVGLLDLMAFPNAGLVGQLVERARTATEVQLRRALHALPVAAPAYAFRVSHPTPRQRFRSSVPLLAVEVAAGAFSSPRLLDGATWVSPRTRRPLRRGMFVARVSGRSMEPLIPDGAYALFDSRIGAPLHGRIVLVQRGGMTEGTEHHAEVTVKRFEGLRRGAARLVPLNPRYPTVRLSRGDEVRVIAEMIEVLGIAPDGVPETA